MLNGSLTCGKDTLEGLRLVVAGNASLCSWHSNAQLAVAEIADQLRRNCPLRQREITEKAHVPLRACLSLSVVQR